MENWGEHWRPLSSVEVLFFLILALAAEFRDCRRKPSASPRQPFFTKLTSKALRMRDKLLVLIFAPCFRPDNRTLFVFVMVRLGVALRVLQDPSEDTLVRNRRPVRHVVASNVLQKRGFVEFLAIDQPRAANQRAARLALS